MNRSVLASLALLSLVACAGADSNDSTECAAPQTRECGSCVSVGSMYPDGGSPQICGSQSCDSTGHWEACQGPNTPVVFSFDGAPVALSTAPGHFEVGQGNSATTDWPSAATPWLVLDRNGDGLINDGSELFGSMTRLQDGARARHGFEALAELDSNGDGVIDSGDAAWTSLRLWADGNGDRAASPDELRTLSEAGVESVSLTYSRQPRCDARGNCEVERAELSWRDANHCERRGAAIDVHLSSQYEPVASR